MANTIERLTEHPSKFQWPKSLLDLLGKVPDQALAEKAGVHVQTVALERHRRGIAPYRPRRQSIEWTEEMVSQLGTSSDRAVAQHLGIDHRSVYRKRRLLGIPAFGTVPHEQNRYSWSPQEIRLLGTAPDRVIAERLGLSHATVQFKRSRLGIAPYQEPSKPIEWTEEMVALLGKITDRRFVELHLMTLERVQRKREELGIPPCVEPTQKVARTAEVEALLRLPNQAVMKRTGLSKTTILQLRRELDRPAPNTRAWRWTSERVAQLGKMPDAELAEEMEITPSAVARKRRALGIEAYCPKKLWTEAEVALLGTASDRDVATQLGRSDGAVKAKRQGLQIPPFFHRSGLPPSVEAPAYRKSSAAPWVQAQ